MSLFEYQTKLLTLRPSVTHQGQFIFIKNSIIVRLITLFTNINCCTIDTKGKYLIISERFLYFFEYSELIKFSEIEYINYEFNDLGTDWGFSIRNWPNRRTDTVEWFTLSIQTKDNRELKICTFLGEGAVLTGWSGLIFGGDEIVDFSGTQSIESCNLALKLSKILNVPIGKQFISKKTIKCPICKRNASTENKTCLYCNADLGC